MAAHADPMKSTMMAMAEIRWLTASRVKIKLKSNDITVLNAEYDAGVLPDDLKLFDDKGDLVTNASFSDILQNFSIEYNGTRYCCFKKDITIVNAANDQSWTLQSLKERTVEQLLYTIGNGTLTDSDGDLMFKDDILKAGTYTFKPKEAEAVGQKTGPKQPRLGFAQYFAPSRRYDAAFTELESRASQFLGDRIKELEGVCIPRKMKTWDFEKLKSELISLRDQIRTNIGNSQNPNDRTARVIAIRRGTGCGKTHLLLEASKFLDAPLVYITYNLEQHDYLNADMNHPRRAILLRILLNLCGASNVRSGAFVNKNIKDFEDIDIEVLREWAIFSLIKKWGRKDIVIGVDEIMKLTQFGKDTAIVAIKTVISELGEVAYRFYKQTKGSMCTVVVTSLNEKPFLTTSERMVKRWTPPPPNREAIEFITKDYIEQNHQQSVAITVAAAGHHYRSIAYAALAFEALNNPTPLKIFTKVSALVKPHKIDLPLLKQYVIAQCKGHDVEAADFEQHVEYYVDNNGAVPPALICTAFDIKKDDALYKIFHLEDFGANFDMFRSSYGIPVIPRTATVHIPTGQNKELEWFYELKFRPNMNISGDALFEIKNVGGGKKVVATNKVQSVDESTYYYPNVENHPWIDRAFVACKFNGEGIQTDTCLVLVQDKINNDVPKTVKNLNDAAEALKNKFRNILLIVNVIGAGKSTKQNDLKYPYVLARKCEDELVKYYSSSFAPMAEFVRSRHELRGNQPNASTSNYSD